MIQIRTHEGEQKPERLSTQLSISSRLLSTVKTAQDLRVSIHVSMYFHLRAYSTAALLWIACCVAVASFPPATPVNYPIRGRAPRHPFGRWLAGTGLLLNGEKEDPAEGEGFDIDSCSSIEELNEFSKKIGGPTFDKNEVSLAAAKSQLWGIVDDSEGFDLEEMTLEQLSQLMMDLGGKEFDGEVSIEEARTQVWDLARTQQEDDHDH